MKLIKLKEDHYIIVDDSEIKEGDSKIKEGDWVYNGTNTPYLWTKGDVEDSLYNPGEKDYKGCKKITHSTQPLGTNEVGNDGFEFDSSSTYPPINILPLFLSEVKELLGEVDMEKKAKESNDNHIKEFKSYPEIRYLHYGKGFISGYNQALEDNKDKKHTEEDMRKIFAHGKQLGLTIAGAIRNGGDKPDEKEWFNESIESLQPQTEWEYVGECKGNNGNGCFMDSSGHDCGCYKRVPKTEWEVEFIDGKLKLKQ